MENKSLLLFLTTIILLAFFYLFFRTPKYLSQMEQWGVSLKKEDVTLISEHENWEGRGEGFYYAELQMNDLNKVKKLVVEKRFQKLPFKENLPINEISNYTNENFKEGFYLYRKDNEDFRDFDLLMIGNNGRVILYYQDF